MPSCYNGRVLIVELTNGDIDIDEPSDAFDRLYGGGSAMGMYYLLKNIDPGIPIGVNLQLQ